MIDQSKFSGGNWKPGKPHGTIVTEAECKCCSAESREYYGGHLIAESIQNPNDVKLLAEAKNLLQFSDMLNDKLRNEKKEDNFIVKPLKETLKRILKSN